MKYLAMIVCVLGLSGCQTMGAVFSGMGNGLSNASNRQTTCMTNGNVYGNQYYGYTNCHQENVMKEKIMIAPFEGQPEFEFFTALAHALSNDKVKISVEDVSGGIEIYREDIEIDEMFKKLEADDRAYALWKDKQEMNFLAIVGGITFLLIIAWLINERIG